LPSITWWPRYYIKSLLSSNSRDDTLLDISDGGHIENLAVFELLRRKCKLVIGIDGGMDSNYEFEDLKNLMRRANNELNIEIKFRPGYNPFEDIKPQADANWRSKKRFGIADIFQHKGDSNRNEPINIGTYIYVKSSLRQDSGASESEKYKEQDDETFDDNVYKYMKFNIDFPHHSTADQFFNSTQFTAYYKLGQSLCKDLFPDTKNDYSREEIIEKFD